MEFLASLAAGVLSLLAPCVLPLAPMIVASSLQAHRLGPLAMAAGLALAFALSGTLLVGATLALGLGPEAMRIGAGALMLAFGAILVAPALQLRLSTAIGPMASSADTLSRRIDPDTLGGQFVAGALLGLVWAPCTGPTLGVAITLASQHDSLARAAAIMLAFATGAIAPLLAMAYGARRLFHDHRARLLAAGRIGKLAMGWVLVILGGLVLSGMDKLIEARLTAAMPDWLVELTTRI